MARPRRLPVGNFRFCFLNAPRRVDVVCLFLLLNYFCYLLCLLPDVFRVMCSECLKGLDYVGRRRYKGKLQWRGEELPDPLARGVVRFSFSTGAENLPPVTAADIFVYLVEGVCFYTKDQFKCYKISDVYNAFVSGQAARIVQDG